MEHTTGITVLSTLVHMCAVCSFDVPQYTANFKKGCPCCTNLDLSAQSVMGAQVPSSNIAQWF